MIVYLQFLFCIQSSDSIFQHRSGKHFEREIYTTSPDLQKKRYLTYMEMTDGKIIYVSFGMETDWWLGRKLTLVECGRTVWLLDLSEETFSVAFKELRDGLRVLKSLA